MKHAPSPSQSGFTLIELSTILLILVALAGLVIPLTGGLSQQAQCQATDATMQAVREAIMGGGGAAGYYSDMLDKYPSAPGATDYKLHYLLAQAGQPAYNPKTRVGWRGPYLMNGATITAADLHSSFTSDNVPTITYTEPFADGDSVVLDAWGRPIVLQVPANPQAARLLSAGPGDGVGPGNAAIDTQITDANPVFDDRVLYLQIADPGPGNPSCGS